MDFQCTFVTGARLQHWLNLSRRVFRRNLAKIEFPPVYGSLLPCRASGNGQFTVSDGALLRQLNMPLLS
jgi:hypothetical protein